MSKLRWKIDPLDDRYDAITILEMPEEWRGVGRLGVFAEVEVWSDACPEWDGAWLDLPGDNSDRDLRPIRVRRRDKPRVHRALLALEEWHRTGVKPVEDVEYGEFPKEVGK